MRLPLAALMSAAMLLQPVIASTCVQPQDVAALKVASLKSELMVTAITCQAHDRYNQFVVKFQPDLARTETELQTYFARAYGANAGKKKHDDYVTNLANDQSTAGLAQGTNLCLTNMAMFDEVMVLPTGDDLPDYAAGKNLAQPLVAVSCDDVPAAPVVTKKKARVITHKKKSA